ncbi:MAG: hypothetical protein AAF488_10520, partial [Planctomycetota bacterium]
MTFELRRALETYVERTRDLLGKLDLDAVESVVDLLYHAYQEGRSVLVIGNGGSACTATHLCE